MGTYRLILAIAVLLSHCGVFFFGINQGVAAVISFLVISGMVITNLIEKRFSNTGGVVSFYIDRALRIYPQYIFYLLSAMIIYSMLDMQRFGFVRMMINAINIPLNFFVNINTDYIVIAPSWSLALELQFYIVIPWLLIRKRKIAASYLSLAFYFICYTGILDTDYFGYRMLSGMLFVFLTGSMVNDLRKNYIHIAVIYLSTLIMYAASFHFKLNLLIYNNEVLLGVIVGLPIVMILRGLRFGRADVIMGNVSYGLYINHTILINTLSHFGIKPQSSADLFLLILASMFIALMTTLFVEKPFYNLRHRIFKKAPLGASI